MTRRIEFSQSVRKAAYARSGGICECGCGLPFGDHPKERPHYDHIVPAELGGDASLENCQVLRVDHHEAKTAEEDMPRIVKARREDKRRTGTQARKRKIPGSKGTGIRKKLNGDVVRVKE